MVYFGFMYGKILGQWESKKEREKERKFVRAELGMAQDLSALTEPNM